MPKTAERSTPRDSAAETAKAIAHPLRTDILTVLHDGPESASGLAKQVGVTLGKLGHHITELLATNAIEPAYTKEVGNHNVIFYRALRTSTYYPRDLAHFSREQQHELNRIIVQSIAAESLAALGAGHLAGDPLASAAWDRVILDLQGYKDLSSCATTFIDRMHEIAAEADQRMQVTGEIPKVYVGAVLAFRRSRTKPATHAAVRGLPELPSR